MRTTLSIDDDVLIAAKERAKAEGRTAGEVITELARASLVARSAPSRSSDELVDEFMGFRPLPHRGGVVTNELIDQLRAEYGV